MVSAGSDTGYRRAHEESEIAAVAERNGKTAKRGVEPSKYKESGFAESAKHHIKDRDNTGALRLVDRCKIVLCRGLCACGTFFMPFYV